MYSGHWSFGSYVPSDALNASMVPIATCLFRVSDLRRRTGSDNLDELGKDFSQNQKICQAVY
jgi:hypothetical protein